jgi:hypothetical protein
MARTKSADKPLPMTAAQARTFEGGESLAAFMAVAELLLARKDEDESFSECECEPYADVFTFNRWLAQGYAVKKGQVSLHHTAWIPMKSRDVDAPPPKEGGEAESRARLRPTFVYLFCRCQVSKAPTTGKRSTKKGGK